MELTQCAECWQEKEIQKLQRFLLENFQGKLELGNSAVDDAINILEGMIDGKN